MTMEEGRRGHGWRNPWRVGGWALAAALLLLPGVAMRFTAEVNWTASDFVFAAVLIGGVGIALELVVRRSGDVSYRAGMMLLLAGAFLLVWLNAAVGMIGSEENPLNLLYAGVLAILLGGGITVRFAPRGMAGVAMIAALAQVLIGGVALLFAAHEPPGAAGLVLLNGVFATLFAAAAAAFRHAAWKRAGV